MLRCCFGARHQIVLDAALLRSLEPVEPEQAARTAACPPARTPVSSPRCWTAMKTEIESRPGRLRPARRGAPSGDRPRQRRDEPCRDAGRPRLDLQRRRSGPRGLGQRRHACRHRRRSDGTRRRPAQRFTVGRAAFTAKQGEALAAKVGPIGFLAREIPDEIPALLPR